MMISGRRIKSPMPKQVEFFKEEIFDEVLCIPNEKPDMERILDVMCWPEVISTKLVETDRGRSFEGQYLSGNKLIIELSIKEKITYVANEPTQTAHAAQYETLKSVFVILPDEWEGKKIRELVRANRITVIPYIEEKSARMLDSRTIYQCMLFLVDVNFF